MNATKKEVLTTEQIKEIQEKAISNFLTALKGNEIQKKEFIKAMKTKKVLKQNDLFYNIAKTDLIETNNLSETKKFCLNNTEFNEIVKIRKIENLNSTEFNNLLVEAFKALLNN